MRCLPHERENCSCAALQASVHVSRMLVSASGAGGRSEGRRLPRMSRRGPRDYERVQLSVMVNTTALCQPSVTVVLCASRREKGIRDSLKKKSE